MSYSTASTYSRVDKAWPAMSESTEARIQRLRELEQRRLEKQAALLASRNSEPIPMPKFESSFTSRRTSVPDNNRTESVGYTGTRKSSQDESVSKKVEKDEEDEVIITSEIIEIDTDIPLIESVNSMAKEKGQEEIKTKEKENVPVKIEDKKLEITTPRTVSTTFVSGPLSPTNTEKTKISVVRKTRLDSLPQASVLDPAAESPSVVAKKSENFPAVSQDSSDSLKEELHLVSGNRLIEKVSDSLISAQGQLSDFDSTEPVSESVETFEVKVTDLLKLSQDQSLEGAALNQDSAIKKSENKEKSESSDKNIDPSNIQTQVSKSRSDAPHTKPYLTLKEFKLQSGIETVSSAEATSKMLQNDENTKDKSLSSATVEVGPLVQSPEKEKTITETGVEKLNMISENSSQSSNISVKSSDDKKRTNTDSTVTSQKPASSEKNHANGSKDATSESVSEQTVSVSEARSASAGTTPDINNGASESENTASENPLSVDSKETVFRLGTLAMKQNLEVAAKIEQQFSNVSEELQAHQNKLEDLQRMRLERKKALEEEGKEDLSHLPVRERFFRTQSVGRIARPVKQQSLPEQIRASRLSRRNSATRAASPGKASEAESPPTARRSRLEQRSADRFRRRTIDSVPVLPTNTASEVIEERPKKPIVDIDSLDKAFARPEQERRNRLEELDRMRIQNRELAMRRDSAPSVGVDVVGNVSSRSDFPSSLIINRGSLENIAQYPIHENVESSFPTSRFTNADDVISRARELRRVMSTERSLPSSTSFNRPTLFSSYSESRLFPLDGGRLSQSGIMSMSTESDLSLLPQSSNQQQSVIDSETDDTPVYVDGNPQGTPLIDNDGRTHWVTPTSPRLSGYLSVIDHLENRNRSSSLDSNIGNFGNVPSYRHRAIHTSESLLDDMNQDHFLADCFLKKYTLKERCALIRKKIYGTESDERGNPDGASHDNESSKNTTIESKT